MRDRVVEFPHRYKLNPVPGETDTYDIIQKPGTVTEEGTPINKATLLSDTTADLYGLEGDDATVDGALAIASSTRTKTSGYVTYNENIDATTVITKTIAVGANKKQGRCVITSSNESSRDVAFVEFGTEPSYALGISKYYSSSDRVTIFSQRYYAETWDESYIPINDAMGIGIHLKHIFISEDTIQLKLENPGTGDRIMKTTIDWEVW